MSVTITYPIWTAAEYQVNIHMTTISERSIEKKLKDINSIMKMTDFIHFTEKPQQWLVIYGRTFDWHAWNLG